MMVMSHILFFQRGNFAKAYKNAEAGLPETYQNQYASVAYVAQLAPALKVTTLCFDDDTHDLTLSRGLHSMALPLRMLDDAKLDTVLAKIAPDMLVLRTPHIGALRYAKAHGIPTFPCLADSFSYRAGMRHVVDLWRHRLLRNLMSGPHVPCVANHNLNASRSLVDVIGLPADRVVPWDWNKIAASPNVKYTANTPPSLFYAGAISDSKGAGDAIDAVGLLHTQGIPATLGIAGRPDPDGRLDVWKKRVQEKGLEKHVIFYGLIANQEVSALMASHDIVLVPSRHSYAEGMPKTLTEGLASRSPLIISDHPVFRGTLKHEQNCLKFEAANPASLAKSIVRLWKSPDLYHALSQRADQTINELSFGLEWSEVIEHFVNDPYNTNDWVAHHALSSQAE